MIFTETNDSWGRVRFIKMANLARIIHDGMSSVVILREIEKRLGLATVLSRHIQAEPVAM
jgi:hypothetical protein